MSDASTPVPVSIIDSAPRQSKAYDPKKRKHPICRQFDLVLESIVRDQDTGDSYVAMAMRHEYGESLTACVMQAAHIRRLRKRHELRSKAHEIQQRHGLGLGTQETTGA